MWTLITGYVLSNIFENQTVKLFKNKFSNKQLSLIGIIIGWLFQEHQREENSLITGGKRFMIEREYRNQFLTQILKILINILFYPYLITSLELITLLCLFCAIFINLITQQLPFLDKYSKIFFNINIQEVFKKLNDKNINQILINLLTNIYNCLDISKILLFIGFFILINNGFLKLYVYIDIFYLFQPIFIFNFIIFSIFCCLWIFYLMYIYIINNYSKNLALLLNIITKKLIIYFSIIYLLLELIIFEINIQNLNTENFFKEIIFKILLFFC